MLKGNKSRKVIERKQWVDALRALAMLFVILGHQVKGKTAYFVFTSPIKIPLFFMITGYVFNYARKDVRAFLKNMLLKLIIPWLCLTVWAVILRGIIKGVWIIPSGLLDIFSGRTAWYMPCCILAEIIWFFSLKLLNRKEYICLMAFVFCLIGIITGSMHVLDFAMLNRAMIAQMYILLGFFYLDKENFFGKISWKLIALLSSIYIMMGVISLIIWPGAAIDVHMNKYYNYPYCFIMIILGCFLTFTIAQRTIRNSDSVLLKIISFLGQNTLPYYLLHSYNIIILSYLLSHLGISIPYWPLVAVKVIFAYIMCALETLFLLRFFPWVLGRKRKNIIL